MDTNDTVIVNTFPTPKEQITAYAIGLAFTAVSTIVVVGSFAALGQVAIMNDKRKARKEAKKNN
jgi:hypothetical protein